MHYRGSQNLRQLLSYNLKVILHIMWKELPQDHINKVVANFTKSLTACMAAMVDTLSICSNSVQLSLHPHQQQTEPPTD